jgi:hypothetical protein
MYARYDALSKFSFVPMVNPSTAYSAGAAVAFADKTMKRETRFPSSSPLLQSLDNTAIIATVVGETTTSETRARELRKIGPGTFRTVRPQLNCLEWQLANPFTP